MSEVQETLATALSRAHETLLTDLRTLKEAVRSESVDIVELRRKMNRTRKHLEDHFCFEERNGYLDTIRNRELRLGHFIEHLAQEHATLLETLNAVIAATEAATCLDSGLADEIQKWIGEVRQHEARENELVQDAFNLDIGAED